ncbi:unnamed protein product [Caenorhabditis sp. 36 PRJEB53466]|nr:unnamed protein product [Caenorhabditis sp. 36 PRJEB53466]
MPPGTSPASDTPPNGPHPPSPPPPQVPQVLESSGLPSSAEEEASGVSQSNANATTPSNTDELMTVAVTSTTSSEQEKIVLKILSPVFEDITKVENISDSEEVLRVNFHGEGSGDNEPELMSTLESSQESVNETMTTPRMAFTTATTIDSESSTTSSTSTATTESSSSSSTSSSEPVTEPITSSTSTSTSIPTSTTTTSTTTISLSTSTPNDTSRDEATQVEKLETKSRPTTKECKDILFLLDSSGNVVQQYEKQKKYIEEIVSQLEVQHPRRLALITFAGRTRQKIVVPLPEEPNSNNFTEKLRKARFLRGVTAAGAAISVTTQYVLQKARNVQVVVVTDGFSFDDVLHQSEALRTVVGSETYATGRYFPVVKNVLLSIGGTSDHVFFGKKEQRLIDALQC